jgi:hypothetical protein
MRRENVAVCAAPGTRALTGVLAPGMLDFSPVVPTGPAITSGSGPVPRS